MITTEEYNELRNYLLRLQKDYNWNYVSQQYLAEDFIIEYNNELNWDNISMYSKLSENLMREFSYKLNWKHISRYQKLSLGFLLEFPHKVDWRIALYNQNITTKQKQELYNRFVVKEVIS